MFRNFSTKPAHVDDFADVADVADVDDVDDVADVTNIADVDDVMKSKLEEAGCGADADAGEEALQGDRSST